MKIITHRFFIHICLTTIITIVSAIVPDPECETSVNQVIAKYLQRNQIEPKTCIVVKNLTNNFNWTTIDPHLCATIHETVNLICELNSNLNLTEPEFAAQMTELRKDTKTIFDIVNNITSVIKDPVYKNAIADKPVIEMLNNQFNQSNGYLLCGSFINNSYNPLCSVLLWTNRALVNTKLSLPKKQAQDNHIAKNASQRKKELIKTSSHLPEEHKPKQNPPTVVKKEEDLTNKQGAVKPVPNFDADPLAVKNTPMQRVKPAESKPQSESKETVISGKSTKPEGTVNKDDVLKPTVAKPENNLPPSHVEELIPDQIAKSEISEAKNKPSTEKETTIAEEENDKAENGLPHDDTGPEEDEEEEKPRKEKEEEKPAKSNHPSPNENKINPDQSSGYPVTSDPEPPQHFFSYFMAVSLICLIFYVGYHKKHKIMGIIFEGRKSRGGRGRRRPNTAGYRKLDCTLEEAVTSQCNSNVTHVIY